MLLRDLVAGIATPQCADLARRLDISGITDDSRAVRPGWLFVARKGTAVDGRAFVADAVARGAVAVLYEDEDGAGDPCPPQSTVVRVKLNAARGGGATRAASAAGTAGGAPAAPGRAMTRAACRMAERLEGDPSQWLALIGITGTNGKTTIAFLVQQMVQAWTRQGQRECGGAEGCAHAGMSAAARACGVIGTVVVDDGVDAPPAGLTTPGGIEVSMALGRMVRNGCRACAMEVSSHALDQGRVSALHFRAGVFTNLTGDHLDYHGTMEEYAGAKAKLFAMLPADGVAVVNADDPWHARMVQECRARVLRCRLRPAASSEESPAKGTERGEDREGGQHEDPGADCTVTVHEARLGWQDVEFAGPFGSVRTRLPLVGRHNAMNALQAAAVAHGIGVPAPAIREALANCVAPPGRLEPVTTPEDPFAVLVDYAHTDDALLNVLTALRPLVGTGSRTEGGGGAGTGAARSGRLIAVFGCGGDRDRTKRPRMMRVACTHADHVIVTSDNPRTEDPEAIIDEIMSGRPEGGATVHRQADRARAIELAVAEARPGDIILIAGKGHEDYQIVGKVKRPFDDRLVARAALGRGPAGPSSQGAGSSDASAEASAVGAAAAGASHVSEARAGTGRNTRRQTERGEA